MSIYVNTQREGPLIRPAPSEKDPHADRCMYCAEKAIGTTESGSQTCGHSICGVVVNRFKKEPTEE